jgi:hypothetical protein
MATASAIHRWHRWSREEYEQMAETGVFGDRRVELVDGVVYDMTPQSRRLGGRPPAAALSQGRQAVCFALMALPGTRTCRTS